nr:helix-turn-helix domain-containing protein [uncultured Oscillibacter sp.]
MRMDCRSFEELPAMLTAAELAGALGISRAGAYALIHSKGFPALRIGKRLMVPKDKLSAWIDRNTGEQARKGF